VPRSRKLIGLAAVLAAALIVPSSMAAKSDKVVRFATFNASLNRNAAGQALEHLSTPGNAQADAVAEIIQRIRPDVLLINEFDFYPGGELADAFQKNYLKQPHNGARPIHYPFSFVAPSNTGITSGFDLNNNGVYDATPGDGAYGDDSFGFGEFEGKFGMAVFSKYPIDFRSIRTFQHFLWKDMPGALLPDDASTPAPSDWYSPAELEVFRLSSKSHWDVPIRVGGQIVHFLVSHPTPPVFDSSEDRNGRRNNDEIRLWADYITGGSTASYIYDDEGTFGGLAPGESFVIAGDQNSDPLDGDSVPGSIQQLLDHPSVNTSFTPSSDGGPYWAEVQDVLNDTHESDPAFDTADFCDTPAFPPCSGPGNLRADYVLPSDDLSIVDGAVFWPDGEDPLLYLTGTGFPVPSSDHRAVWIDVSVPKK
jgi:Endonuclease/Exonuclease/phosphatase family